MPSFAFLTKLKKKRHSVFRISSAHIDQNNRKDLCYLLCACSSIALLIPTAVPSCFNLLQFGGYRCYSVAPHTSNTSNGLTPSPLYPLKGLAHSIKWKIWWTLFLKTVLGLSDDQNYNLNSISFLLHCILASARWTI